MGASGGGSLSVSDIRGRDGSCVILGAVGIFRGMVIGPATRCDAVHS